MWRDCPNLILLILIMKHWELSKPSAHIERWLWHFSLESIKFMCLPEILLQLPSQGYQRQHCIRLFFVGCRQLVFSLLQQDSVSFRKAWEGDSIHPTLLYVRGLKGLCHAINYLFRKLNDDGLVSLPQPIFRHWSCFLSSVANGWQGWR